MTYEGFWTSAQPDGFSHSVQLLASGATPGVLQPGESIRVPVYYAGWQQPWNFSYPPIEWQLGVVKADDTTPVNWADFKDSMKPPSINAQAWDALWTNFTAQVGNTWGGYVRMLDDNAAYLGRLGERVLDLGDLLGFEFMQADGLNPMRSLAGAVDAAVEAPGLALTFSRSLAQSLSRRFDMGPFGRGWSHNWQYSLATAADGTVTITGPGGSHRTFQPDSRTATTSLSAETHGKLLSHRRRPSSAFRKPTASSASIRADGMLDYMQDLNGNRITAGYNGANLTSLTHSSGRSPPDRLQRRRVASKASPIRSGGRRSTPTMASTSRRCSRPTAARRRTRMAAGTRWPTSPGPAARERSFTYDAQGRLASTWTGENEATVTFEYDNAGGVTVARRARQRQPLLSSITAA